MKARTPLLAALLAAGALLAAAPGAAAQGVPPDAAHSSRNALDWAGVYEGTLPCADCPGLRTRLSLRQDGSFKLSTQATGRDARPRITSGRFAWLDGGNAIALTEAAGGLRFAVGEGRIALLDAGAAPSWPQGAQHVLTRVAQAPGAGTKRMLEVHRWTLTAANDKDGKPIAALATASPVVLSFDAGRVAFTGGCNRSFGGYRIDADGKLHIGRLASTMMACDPQAMQLDAALADLLALPMKVKLVAGAQLLLTTPAGATLAFAGQMTPEARYGAATRVFLEVAPQTVACPAPPAGASACLQVREIRFDEKGLRVGAPGEWQPFAGAIEGYTHQPGVRNVLRLKRFDRGAGGPGPLYVLDLVVESETVSR